MTMLTWGFGVSHLVIHALPSAMAAGIMTSVTISKQGYLGLYYNHLVEEKRNMAFQVHSLKIIFILFFNQFLVHIIMAL